MLIVVGAVAGNYLGIMGYIQTGWFWFGNQGLSYIQLGRAWQIPFFAGLVIWSVLVLRAMWPTLAQLAAATRQFWSGRIRLEHLLWASTVNIAALYVFGMIPLTCCVQTFLPNDPKPEKGLVGLAEFAPLPKLRRNDGRSPTAQSG